MTGHPEPEKAYKSTKATGFIKKPLERAQFLNFMQRTMQVISVGKRAESVLMQANERLSYSLQWSADVDAILRTHKLATATSNEAKVADDIVRSAPHRAVNADAQAKLLALYGVTISSPPEAK